ECPGHLKWQTCTRTVWDVSVSLSTGNPGHCTTINERVLRSKSQLYLSSQVHFKSYEYKVCLNIWYLIIFKK
ncbi:3336_t:CDS:2, partial [Entrophospora sp. SA101]